MYLVSRVYNRRESILLQYSTVQQLLMQGYDLYGHILEISQFTQPRCGDTAVDTCAGSHTAVSRYTVCRL